MIDVNSLDNSEINTESKICYRIVEYLFQSVLPMHGEGMDKYDIRVIKKRLSSKVRAEALVEELRAKAESKKLSHHLHYEVEVYSIPQLKKKR